MQNILIVDDRASNLLLLERTLKLTNVEVVKASNGKEALAATQYHDFALAILDVQMPEMDGFELAQQLRDNPTTRSLPIIFLSAVYSSIDHVFKGYGVGAVDYIVKPYDLTILLSKVSVFLEMHRHKQALEIARDEAQRHSDELANSEQRIRALLETTADGVIAIDSEGIIDTFNPAAETLFGYTADEVIGNNIRMLMPEPDRRQHDSSLENYAQTGKAHIIGIGREVIGQRKDGSTFPIHLAIGEFLVSGRRMFSGIICDITERKQTEEQLKERARELALAHAKTAASNRELETFSYSVSHDLRAPLRSMVSFSQVLLSDYGQQLDETGCDYLNRIVGAGQRMGVLIDDLLHFSQVINVAIDKQTVDLSALARELMEEISHTEPERRVEWVVAPDLSVEGDAALLRVVLDNLLRNAWKYTSKRDSVRIEVGTRRDADEMVYFVRDNGAGFDMQYEGKLFITFQRLHTADEFPGSGIGLATVQRIIHRHGGRIWAEGIVDQGACFSFTL